LLTFVLVFIATASQGAAAQTFQHPGVLVSKAQLDFMKAQVNAHIEPFYSAYQNAIASPYGSLTPTVTPSNSLQAGPSPAGPPSGGDIDCGSSSSPDTGCTADDEDGTVAYVQALLFYITGNQTYANNAIKNLNAYSHVTAFTNSNGPLQAAWSSSKWPRAAEIMRYAPNSPWTPADAAAFGTMMNNVMVPIIHNGSTNNANWELSMIEGMIGVAVYNNDATLYNHALGMLNTDIPKFVQSTGQNAETCRDMGHALFELAAMINAAETVHIQGGNVYETQKSLLAAELEFHSGLLEGKSEPLSGCSSVTLTPDRPTFVIGYNEFHNRLGMSLPNTQQWLPTVFANQVTSPGAAPGTPVDHHMVVYETLTHAADAGTTPQPDFTLTPSPTSVTVTSGANATYSVSVAPVNSFTGNVALTISGLPTNATASFNPSTISGGTGSSTLTITTSGVVAGNYTLTVTGTSTSPSLTHTAQVTLNVNGQQDFTLSANPSSLAVIVGSSTSSTISVGSLNGFSGAVALSASISPAGPAVTLASSSVNAPGSTSLNLSTTSSTATGPYTITITGTGGSLTHSITVALQVNPVPPPQDFSITATPSTRTVNQGSSTTYTATIAPINGYTGTVAMSASGLPSGATAIFNPQTISGGSGSSTVTISTAGGTPTGPATITITGTDSSLALTHTATVGLTVNSAPQCVTTTTNGPWQNTAFANQTGTFTVTYDATPSAASINAVIGLSNGVQTAYTGFAAITRFNPSDHIDARSGGGYTAINTIPYSGGVIYHFRLVVNIPAHTYSAFVTPDGGTEQTIGTNLNFRSEQATVSQLNWVGAFSEVGTESMCNFSLGGDFSLTASPNPLSVTAGNAATGTVTVTPIGGFTGVVALSVSGAPTGLTATLNPASVTGSGTSTLNVSTASTTTPGTYTLTITGTSGNLTHTTTLKVIVGQVPQPDFTVSASPNSLTVTAGNSASSTVNVGIVNGFSGAVALSVTGAPSGATATLSSSSVNAPGTATLNISTAGTMGQSTSTLTITATSGGVTHTATVALTVNPVQTQCVSTTTNGPWQNAAFATQTGTFTVTYDATPSAASINAVIGLSGVAAGAYTDLAAITRFNPSDNIDVRSGGSYTAISTIPYSGGVIYHFRLVVNVAAHTYSAYVTPDKGTEQTIGTNLNFRTEQNTVSQLSWVGAFSGAGTETLCNFALNSGGPNNGFTVAASPASQAVTQGQSTTYTVTVTPTGSYSNSVALTVSGLPAGATASFNPSSVAGGSGQSTLTVTTSTSTPASTTPYTLTITGTDSSVTPNLTSNTSVGLVVNPVVVKGFTLSASPSTVTVNPGASAAYTATVSPVNVYTGTVSLSASGLPSGATASFNPASIGNGSGSSSVTIATSSSTPPGSYTITITGSDSGAGLSHPASVTLTVNTPNFTFSASPASQTVTAGTSTTFSASVSPVNGYAGTVTASASGLPSGATANTCTVAGGSGSCTLTITTTSTANSNGPVNITITGTDGALTHSATVSLTVNPSGGTCAHGNGPLDPNATPGCNFDLSIWSLQLPIGQPGNPTTITNTQLENGFTDAYFFTGSDGAMDFFDPGVNCVTTQNSTHCRSELREVNPDGTDAVWPSSTTNTMSATVAVTQDAGAPVIGQIHLDPAFSVKPLIELYYNYHGGGNIVAGVEIDPVNGGQNTTTLAPDFPLGTKFTYEISYTHDVLTVTLNGTAHVLSVPSGVAGHGGYFKAGDYGQIATGASVSIYSLKVTHGP
jgi:uncharacterized membrane protein